MHEPPLRTLTDRHGVTWTLRVVTPERVERRMGDRRQEGAATAGRVSLGHERRRGPDRRVSPQLRVRLPAAYAHGWLLLESATGERRRYAPVPAGWERLSEGTLELLTRVGVAEPTTEG